MPANATADVQSTDAKDVKAQAKPLNDAAKPFVPQAGAGRAAGRAADDRTCYTCGETGHVSHRCDEFQTKLCYYHSQERCRNTDDACPQAHGVERLRVYCETCECTHKMDAKCAPPAPAKSAAVFECRFCGADHFNMNDCPERYCKTCKNDSHWTKACLKCAECGSAHRTYDCPYMFRRK